MIGIVIHSNVGGKTLVQTGDECYVINYSGQYRGQEVVFDELEAVHVPSMFVALSLLQETTEKIREFVNELKKW